MRRKEILKWIKREAQKLPEEGYLALHKVIGKKKDDVGVAPEMHKSNHARRLKRIWDKTHSFEEINKYFLKFDMQLNYEQ